MIAVSQLCMHAGTWLARYDKDLVSLQKYLYKFVIIGAH